MFAAFKAIEMGFDAREEGVEFWNEGREELRLSGGESGGRKELKVLEVTS